MVYMGDYMKGKFELMVFFWKTGILMSFFTIAPVSMPPLSSDYHEVKIDMPRQQQ